MELVNCPRCRGSVEPNDVFCVACGLPVGRVAPLDVTREVGRAAQQPDGASPPERSAPQAPAETGQPDASVAAAVSDEESGGLRGILSEAREEIVDGWKGEGSNNVQKLFDRGEIIWAVGKFIVIGIVVIVGLALALRGCAAGAAAKAVSCEEFNSMSLSEQNDTLKALLSAHGKDTGARNLVILHTQVMMGCFGGGDAKVNDAIDW